MVPSRKLSGGARPLAAQPHLDDAEHVGAHLRAVADVLHHLLGRPLQVGQPRIPGGQAGRERLAQGQVPPGFFVHPRQRGAEYLGKRFLGLEGGQEQRPDQVRVGLQRETPPVVVGGRLQRVQPGRHRVGLPGPDPPHQRPRPRPPGGPHPVLGLGRRPHQPPLR